MTDTLTKKETPDEVTRAEQTYGGVISPRFDIWETDDELVLYGDLPGVAPDDLDIQFENRALTIHGKVDVRHENVNFLYGEYGVGDFYRSFTVGEAVDAANISAELNNGVCIIHLPKSEAAKPRRIEIKT
jgi:HSP20 family molecular chaperone IbpA